MDIFYVNTIETLQVSSLDLIQNNIQLMSSVVLDNFKCVCVYLPAKLQAVSGFIVLPFATQLES